MTKRGNVILALVILGIMVVLGVVVYCDRKAQYVDPTAEYYEKMNTLNDSIRVLKDDIAHYKAEIEQTNLERDRIREEVQLILSDNEKIDAYLANGTWDDNIRFLADFLSGEDTIPE